MTVTNTAIFPQTPKHGVVQVVNADGTAKKTVATAGVNGSKIVSLVAASDDTSARTFQLFVTRGGTSYLLGTVTVPIAAGTDGTNPSVDILGGGTANLLPGLPVDNDGQRYVLLENGDTLQVAATVAVTAAKTVHFNSNGADF